MIIYIKLFLTAFFWGGTFIAGRTIAGHVGPYSAAFLRFAVASFFLFLFAWRVEGRLPVPGRRMWGPVTLLGLTGVFAYNVFFFKGLGLVEAGRASLIIANNPILITLFSAIIFRDRLTTAKVCGILLSVLGAMVVISRGDPTLVFSGDIGIGEGYIFCCVLSWVAYSLIGKFVMKELTPLVAVCWSALIGAAALSIPALLEGLIVHAAAYRPVDWISLFYLGFFGTVLGFVWYYQGIQGIGPMKASQFINFVPISAIVLAFFILGEPVTPSLIAGAVLVLSGVYLTNRPPRKTEMIKQ